MRFFDELGWFKMELDVTKGQEVSSQKPRGWNAVKETRRSRAKGTNGKMEQYE